MIAYICLKSTCSGVSGDFLDLLAQGQPPLIDLGVDPLVELMIDFDALGDRLEDPLNTTHFAILNLVPRLAILVFGLWFLFRQVQVFSMP